MRAKFISNQPMVCPHCNQRMVLGTMYTDGFGIAFYDNIAEFSAKTSLLMMLRALIKRRILFRDRIPVWNCKHCKILVIKWQTEKKSAFQEGCQA